MNCLDPRPVSFDRNGRITFSQKTRDKSIVPFKLPCGQCLECRLDYARQWAIRCVHEAQMHEKNSFITLTYSDEKLPGPKLVYDDFQRFMKRLRKTQNYPIGVFVTGEYGEEKKRPHWHAILFGYFPSDARHHRRSPRGDEIWKSDSLDRIWGLNDGAKKPNEIGSVTFESAGYCARYAAKKLVHGYDGFHEFEPISKKSSKHAIGKKWIEKFWPDVFNHGKLILPNKETCSIPRYYEKWLKAHEPDAWLRYVTGVKLQKIEAGEKKAAAEAAEQKTIRENRSAIGEFAPQRTPTEARSIILKANFKLLQANLKL